MFLIVLSGMFANLAATVLISPTAEGGFENGATLAANGWTDVSGTEAMKWWVGTPPVVYAGTNCAFSSIVGTAWTAVNTTSIAHIYRDVTFPAGETTIYLTFYYKTKAVDSGNDYIKVFLAPTTLTPVAGTAVASADMIGVTTTPFYVGTTAYVQYSIVIPAANAGTTKRLIFSWRNNAANPKGAAALDNIALITLTVPPPVINVTGTFSAFSTTVGTPSASQSVTVSGTDLTANIAMAARAGYEYSTTNAAPWTTTLSLLPTFSGSV